MKYSELERFLRKYFAMSHHHSAEVKTKTLINILKDAGIN